MISVDESALSAFRERLAAERQRMVCDEAEKGSLPAIGFISRLADLDSAIAAVEAVIDESGARAPHPRAA